MKNKLFLLPILFLFLLLSCNKDKITLKIVTPAKNAEFFIEDNIDVKVSATTKKGKITQVVLTVDTLEMQFLTKEPFDFTIKPKTFKKEGFYFLGVMAYSSEGVREGAAIDIKIKE